MQFLTAAAEVLFPLRCAACLSEGYALCEPCASRIQAVHPQCAVCGAFAPAQGRIPAGRTCASCRQHSSLAVFLSPFSYRDEAIERMVRAFKYDRVTSIGSLAGTLLCAWIRDQRIRFPSRSVIVPVPLSPGRLRVRGFNQAALLADEISACTGISLCAGVLLRSRTGQAQARLSRQERRRNIAGAFLVRNPERIAGRTVVAVDDVKTTGATLEEAARCLHAAGARSVWAVTLAHSGI